MNDLAIRARHISHTYPDGHQAVDRVSFDLRPSESMGIIGRNGAGKTTLLHVIAGLLPSGEDSVSVFGKTYGSKDQEEKVRRRVGFVFQETEDQLFCPTVFDDVAFGPLNFGFPRDEIQRLVGDALGQVGLSGYESRVTHHLSSGERRRVALASVLSFTPQILLLDEPTSDLDPRGKKELAELLAKTSQARIIASHDLEFLLLTCERLLLMDAGRVVADERSLELVGDQPLLQRHGLEIPLGLRGLDEVALRELLESARESPDSVDQSAARGS